MNSPNNPRPFPKKKSAMQTVADISGLDTGVRTPGVHAPPPTRTHRDAAADVKRRAEEERLERESSQDPAERAERQLDVLRQAEQAEDDDDTEES